MQTVDSLAVNGHPRQVSSQLPPAEYEKLWQAAPHDTAKISRWLAELTAHGLAVDPDAKDAPCGLAASLEPTTGDPQLLGVLPAGDQDAFWVDRRSMRLSEVPRTSLAEERDVVRAADLADRAQLILGEPLLVRYAVRAGKLAIAAVRPLSARIRFTPSDYRETASLIAQTGTLAPLAIDALLRALRVEGDRGEEPRVRRIFARAYRRIDEHHTPWSQGERDALRAVGRVSRLTRDVLLALQDAEALQQRAHESLARCDAEVLEDLDRRDLIAALEARMRIVVQALAFLERSRLASLSLLPVLEVVCAQVPREFFEALAVPRRTPERQGIDRQLASFAERSFRAAGELRLPPPPSVESQAWRGLRSSLASARMLGMDVRPDTMGASDEDLACAVAEAWTLHRHAPEEARGRAERALLQLATKGALGILGVGPAGALILSMRRLADAKGTVAEVLAAALLRLRAGALEAGKRLSGDGVLERAEDTLYMPLDEIEEALEGELGAYAARVRLRREDDRRWRRFAAPRWISARPK